MDWYLKYENAVSKYSLLYKTKNVSDKPINSIVQAIFSLNFLKLKYNKKFKKLHQNIRFCASIKLHVDFLISLRFNYFLNKIQICII